MRNLGAVLSTAVVTAAVLSALGAGPAGRVVFNAPGRAPGMPFSDGILAGNTLYLAGRIGLDPKTGKPPESPAEEARLVMESLKGTLAQAGMTVNDLVYVQISCTDLSLLETFNAVYRSYFTTKDLPTRQFVGAASLLRGGHFELQSIAVRR